MKHLISKSSSLIAYCLLLLLIVFAFIKFPIDDFYKDVSNLYTFLYLSSAALGLVAIDYFLDYCCWYWVVRQLKIPLNVKQSFPLFCSASAAGTLPFVMGTMVRPFLLSNMKRCPFSKGIILEGIDKIIDILGVVTLLGAIALFHQSVVAGVVFFLFNVIALPFFLLFGLKLFNKVSLTKESKVNPGTFFRLVNRFVNNFNEIVPDLEKLVRSRVLNVFIASKAFGWILNGTALYLLLQIAPIDLELPAVIFQATTLEVIGHASGFPGGIGIIEGALGGALLFYKLPKQFLVPVIGMYRITNFWFWIIPGFFSYSYFMKISGRKVKKEEKELNDGAGYPDAVSTSTVAISCDIE
jgi:uncharacterized protein (TIRG00374 family)